jgi:hypothetical protein
MNLKHVFLEGADSGISHLRLLVLWTLSIVWYFKINKGSKI